MERGIAVLGRIAAACASTSSVEVRLSDALEELTRLVPAVATLVTAPVGGRGPHGTVGGRSTQGTVAGSGTHSTVADSRTHGIIVGSGYPPEIAARLSSAATAEDVVRAGCLDHRLPIRWRDLPGDPRDLPTVGELLAPAGYREGVTVSLHARDGRHTATLHCSVDDVRHPDDHAREVLAAASTCLGEVCGELHLDGQTNPVAASTSRSLWLRTDGATVNDAGRAVRLAAPIHAAVRRLAAAGGGACVVRDTDGWTRVSALTSAKHVPVRVVLEAAPMLHGLTVRELEVLGRLCEGWSNAQIAQAQVVSPRTVGTHVEHILAKLDTPTRAGAVSRAVAEGLRILP